MIRELLADEVRHTRGATTASILGRTVHLIGASDARAEGRTGCAV